MEEVLRSEELAPLTEALAGEGHKGGKGKGGVRTVAGLRAQAAATAGGGGGGGGEGGGRREDEAGP